MARHHNEMVAVDGIMVRNAPDAANFERAEAISRPIEQDLQMSDWF